MLTESKFALQRITLQMDSHSSSSSQSIIGEIASAKAQLSEHDFDKLELVSSHREIQGRAFEIHILRMSNGSFVSITEDRTPRLGPITLCIKSERGFSSSSLIPDRRGSIFSSMIGELVAEETGGIAVISLFLREEIDTASMKTLINEVERILSKED